MFAAGIAVVVNYMICVDAVPSARPAYRVINKHVRPRTMTQRSSQPDSRLTPSNRPLLCESESLSWPLTTSGLIAIGRMADMSTIHRHSECRSQLHALPTPPAFSPPYSLRAIQSASAPAAPSGRILHQPEDQPPPLSAAQLLSSGGALGPPLLCHCPWVSQGRKRSARARGRKRKADLDRSICQGAISGTGFFPRPRVCCMCIMHMYLQAVGSYGLTFSWGTNSLILWIFLFPCRIIRGKAW